MDEKIDNFIRQNIGLYWDSCGDLAKVLKDEFGDVIYSDDEWFEIARCGINQHYS
jgi:hypothetical protein